MNSQWAAYQNTEAFASRVATLYGAGEAQLAHQKARYGKLVERFEKEGIDGMALKGSYLRYMYELMSLYY